MENRQYFTEFVILDGDSSEQEANRSSSSSSSSTIGNYFFEIEADETAVNIDKFIDMAKSMIVLESKRKGFLVSKEQIHFRQFNRI